ncbi:MAG: ATP-binding protein [Rhodobacteraceae bacterium]|uniref:sensor histidine kinase n=2 Tax=unclassified Marivita TaxID=2632480 RepID=UPI000D796DCA|nr:ATP-binding protein [Paracoccaceae bacterium]PWL35388.1 MAG: two-component sensor histidine kinase [Marivita sp. XM-24bin2]
MSTRVFRLRSLAWLWVALAMLSASIATALWLRSSHSWSNHLSDAKTAGLLAYEALRTGLDTHPDLHITPLSPADAMLAEAGKFERISGMPQPAYVTVLSLQNNEGGLRLAAVSDVLQYPVADIPADVVPSASAQLASLTRLFATYCSTPILIARYDNGAWQQVDGSAIWGCDAVPRDLRLLAVLVGLVAVAALFTLIGNTTQTFGAFAQAFRNRRFGGPESYETRGPRELREIVDALNAFLETERKQLANRAAVLSSVSHDLGTPATRLRLRTALIQDEELRRKLESDIDAMTGIIESALTYTRAEMNAEAPRKLSLDSLVEAIVSDYQDVGEPVTLVPPRDVVVQGGRSLFMSRRGQSVVTTGRQVIISGRPVALKRAITNLIDNALKYGRSASVVIETDARTATIVVEDEGSDTLAKDVEALIGPFERGDNTAFVEGHGLGLSIVVTIAALHNGALTFENSATGLQAKLRIQRA